jgi:hypothetical protein
MGRQYNLSVELHRQIVAERDMAVAERDIAVAERDMALEILSTLATSLEKGRFLGLRTVRTGCVLAAHYPSRAVALRVAEQNRGIRAAFGHASYREPDADAFNLAQRALGWLT